MSIHPSTRPLSETAHHICIPDGIVSSGWSSVEAQCGRVFGVGFDQWQKDIGRLALAKRTDGLYAAAVGGVILSIPRQTGKTYLVAWMVFALCTLVPDLTVVWTAHRTRTSDETFEKMKAMALRPKVQPYIEGKPRTANGQQQIAFVNGSRILFGAREQGFGRGFDMVDILILDEGQILTENAMTDMVPATNAAPNGLVIIMGTPPRPKDPGEVFAARRQDGLDGDPDTLYIELSAQRGSKIIDWEQVAIANPSFPHRTSKTAILRMQKLLGSDINFYREAYGIWDEEVASSSRLITPEEWEAIQVSEPPTGGVRSIGVAFNQAGSRVSVACSVKHDHGVYLELVGGVSGELSEGLRSLARWLVSHKETLAEVWIAGGLGKSLALELQALRMPERMYRIVTTPEYFTACSTLYSDIQDRQITVPVPDEGDALDASVAVCDQKIRPSGWGWQATTPDGDETPIEAASVALMAARTTKRRPTGERRDPTGRPASRRGVARGRVAGRR